MVQSDDDVMMSPCEAAAYIGVSVRTIYRWLSDKYLPAEYRTPGKGKFRKWAIWQSDLDALNLVNRAV